MVSGPLILAIGIAFLWGYGAYRAGWDNEGESHWDWLILVLGVFLIVFGVVMIRVGRRLLRFGRV